MKNAPMYTRRVRALITQVKKDGAKSAAPSPAATDDLEATHVLLLGVLCGHASEQRSAAALDKLLAAMVDLNELRVTPVAEIVQIIGAGFPHSRPAAEGVLQVLTALFNRIHDLDMGFLKGLGKRSGAAFINSLDGLDGHASAFLKQRHLGIHLIPLDTHMFSFLHKGEFIADKANVAEAQRFLATIVKERDGLSFYSMFKRYAATHSPPKSKKKKATKKKAVAKKKAAKKKAAKKAPAKPATKAAKKPPAQRSGRKTPAKKPASKKAAAKKSASKKPAPKKAAAKKRPASKKAGQSAAKRPANRAKQ